MLCPFHEERTPSFSVNAVDKLYYCFGCGKGGDAITFVREVENLDFVGAIEWLAEVIMAGAFAGIQSLSWLIGGASLRVSQGPASTRHPLCYKHQIQRGHRMPKAARAGDTSVELRQPVAARSSSS